MTENEYAIAWIGYLCGAVMFYMAFCYLTHWIKPFELRYLLRVPVAAILFAPAYADPGQPYWAPALIVALFDLASHEPGLGLRGIKLILWVTGFLFVLLVIESIVRHAWAARRARKMRSKV